MAGVEHLVCFAVKSNSNRSVLRALARLHSGFGIVSLFDLPALVTVISLGMAIVLTVDQVMQRMLMRPR